MAGPKPSEDQELADAARNFLNTLTEEFKLGERQRLYYIGEMGTYIDDVNLMITMGNSCDIDGVVHGFRESSEYFSAFENMVQKSKAKPPAKQKVMDALDKFHAQFESDLTAALRYGCKVPGSPSGSSS
ncbi:hypothetical protein LCGC14_2555460 [marine sediment metagenome]|uniref:Uncharacterized protein n=1 Tax=marine sediment metagenome TaxID=412755 RepID=A0A0F9DER0_9ZZZZ